jgi:hypothetical protein
VLKEFLDNISGYKIVALITESIKGEISLTAAVHEQVSAEQFLQSLGGGKVFNFNLGNYKILQTAPASLPFEVLENKLVDIIKNFG